MRSRAGWCSPPPAATPRRCRASSRLPLAGLAWTALLMSLFMELLGLHYLLAQVLTTALLLLWHYAGNALWTFRRGRRDTESR